MMTEKWSKISGSSLEKLSKTLEHFLKRFYKALEHFLERRWPTPTLKSFSTEASVILAILNGYEQDATLEAALGRMTRLEKALKRNDGRRFFLRAYRQMTESLQKTLEKQVQKPFFNDPQWVDEFGACFARLYFKRLKAYYEGGQTAQPACWRQAFLVAALSPAPRFRAMLTGINGHLLYDIPTALAETRVFELPGLAMRREDFLRINKLIWRNINPIKRMVLASKRERALGLLSEALDEMINLLVFNGFVLQREHAWNAGQQLAQHVIDPAELDYRACKHLTRLNTWSGIAGIVLEIAAYYWLKPQTALETEAEANVPVLV